MKIFGDRKKMKKTVKKMTEAQDDAFDKKRGIKEDSKADIAIDAKNGLKAKKKSNFKKALKGSYKKSS